MAVKTINEMIRDITSYISPSNPISDADIGDTYIPLAVKELVERIANKKTIDIGTDTLNASTGDIYDDRILAYLAADYMDKAFDTVRINPFTNEEINRNRQAAEELIKNRYSVNIGYGRTMLPSPLANAYRQSSISRTDTTDFD